MTTSSTTQTRCPAAKTPSSRLAVPYSFASLRTITNGRPVSTDVIAASGTAPSSGPASSSASPPSTAPAPPARGRGRPAARARSRTGTCRGSSGCGAPSEARSHPPDRRGRLAPRPAVRGSASSRAADSTRFGVRHQPVGVGEPGGQRHHRPVVEVDIEPGAVPRRPAAVEHRAENEPAPITTGITSLRLGIADLLRRRLGRPRCRHRRSAAAASSGRRRPAPPWGRNRRRHGHPVVVDDDEHAALRRRCLQLRQRLATEVAAHLIGASGQLLGQGSDPKRSAVVDAGRLTSEPSRAVTTTVSIWVDSSRSSAIGGVGIHDFHASTRPACRYSDHDGQSHRVDVAATLPRVATQTGSILGKYLADRGPTWLRWWRTTHCCRCSRSCS